MSVNNFDGILKEYKVTVLLPNQKLVALSWQEFQSLKNSKPNNSSVPFGTFCLGIGTSFLISLITNLPSSSYTFAAFLSMCVVGYGLGIFFIYMWYRKKIIYSDTLTDIGKRFALINEGNPCIFDLQSGILLPRSKKPPDD